MTQYPHTPVFQAFRRNIDEVGRLELKVGETTPALVLRWASGR